ncbi:hypothetical protein [Bacillus toyonensis]|uniref:Uncharacterized protein n=1 Tax=Bacillus toyonensis TaxID=155322 RepID=A0A2A8HJC1_9BACI|nr:hypothetical protein [Bacillus toyonensis]PEQ09125.1 hypothetical protein CN585_05570 [Bacillus toyonensis]
MDRIILWVVEKARDFMKGVADKLFSKWLSIPKRIRIVSLLIVVVVVGFINFVVPGIQAIQVLFTNFHEIGMVKLVIAVISSLTIFLILKKK